MASDQRVQQLLLKILDNEITPEEACRSCPELLGQVREGLSHLEKVATEVNGLFTDSKSAEPDSVPTLPGYEVQEVLGRGGMGVVYKARHLQLNRPVALKMLLAGAYARAEERTRFLREAEAVAGLRHANIVQVYDVGEQDGQPYFTMEFIEGGSLAQKLVGVPQPARQAATLVSTLADAMQTAHRGGIIHRDLKPANVLLTADGTPKISDFGLARSLGKNDGITHSGYAMGTPSYMSPEQARGLTHDIGPAADIYSLGAVLYELLTGRPPFSAESAAETIHQVVTEEPVPPSRLNASVPRDLETICLTCLRKEPAKRYSTAAKLSLDLQHFLSGEPITARPVSAIERTAKWVRRRPALAAIIIVSSLLVGVVTGGGLWVLSERASNRRAVDNDLRETTQALQRSAWAAADAALARASHRLGNDNGAAELRARIERSTADLRFSARLDAIRSQRADRDEAHSSLAQSSKEYEAIFVEAGLGKPGDLPADVASRIRASDVCGAWLAALDDWQDCKRFGKPDKWLQDVALETDLEQRAWREPVRDKKVWDDAGEMKKIAKMALENNSSPNALVLLGNRLAKLSVDDGLAFLKQAQLKYPGDFWAAITAGDALTAKATELRDLSLDASKYDWETLRYYQCALGIRPDSPIACNKLACSLTFRGRTDESIGYFANAVRLDPKAPGIRRNFGVALTELNRYEEAIPHFQVGLERAPNDAGMLRNFANSLYKTGQPAKALVLWAQSQKLEPKSTRFQDGITNALLATNPSATPAELLAKVAAIDPANANSYAQHLIRAYQARGQIEEVCLCWQKVVGSEGAKFKDCNGYAELSLFLGREEEYRRACKTLIERFGGTTDARTAEQIGRACLLATVPDEVRQKAVALVDLAMNDEKLKKDWLHSYFRFAKGLAEYRVDRFESAISYVDGNVAAILGPAPGIVRAMAEHRLGRTDAARRTFSSAIASFYWVPSKATSREAWMYHALRREAEALILPSLQAYLDGKHETNDFDECVGMLGACQFKKLNRAQARIYKVIKPNSSLKQATQAAKCIALAANGIGADCAGLGESEKADLRKQAREYLARSLKKSQESFNKASAAERTSIKESLTEWLHDSDLSGIREPEELKKLPAAEREELQKFWSAVAEMFKRVT